jgi:hypothetical protein
MPARVVDAMIRNPKVWSPSTTVAQVNEAFLDDHLHAVLIVDDTGILLSVIERPDTEEVASHVPAASIGRLHGRATGPRVLLSEARRVLDAGRSRRLAVVVDDGALVGLLCLKRSRRGFCADSDVAARRKADQSVADLHRGRSRALESGIEAGPAERGRPVRPFHALRDTSG